MKTVGGVPITANPVVILGNRVVSYKDFEGYVERGETDQLDLVD